MVVTFIKTFSHDLDQHSHLFCTGLEITSSKFWNILYKLCKHAAPDSGFQQHWWNVAECCTGTELKAADNSIQHQQVYQWHHHCRRWCIGINTLHHVHHVVVSLITCCSTSYLITTNIATFAMHLPLVPSTSETGYRKHKMVSLLKHVWLKSTGQWALAPKWSRCDKEQKPQWN